METTIIVVRHGETEWNTIGRWQGYKDSPLTKNGNLQASVVAQNLSSIEFTALYCSDLGRALETATYISKATGKEILKDQRLRERGLGIFEGLTTDDMIKTYPEAYEEFQKGDKDFRLEGGESAQEKFDRNIACFNDIAEKHPGETVVVVCHGGVVDSLFRYVIKLPIDTPRRFKIWNTGKSVFSYEDGTWQLLTFGDISHLDDLETLDDV